MWLLGMSGSVPLAMCAASHLRANVLSESRYAMADYQ